MKASPGPLASLSSPTDTPASSAMKPRMANTTSPEKREVAQLDRATSTASRWQFLSNLGWGADQSWWWGLVAGGPGSSPVVGGEGDDAPAGRAQGEDHLKGNTLSSKQAPSGLEWNHGPPRQNLELNKFDANKMLVPTKYWFQKMLVPQKCCCQKSNPRI